ncbi:hypothetical protein N7456_012342 [Penicillium angulare]|uniref:AB hydrolase-1 domain-containing protein n=1 Tax=Penicillium angulare TaxID=116970 RepID=A0A9W9K113_9EURO|nr:hypothetical protein N7456_012342 [Penicillium angulare]
MPQERINTSFGELHTVVQGNLASDKTLLLLHANSSCWQAFTPILDDEVLKSTYKMIAFDFPGHGESSDALDSHLAYNIPGYAKAAIEVLQHFQVKSYVAFGSSLGGHVAWDMIKFLESNDEIQVRGVMASGSTPIGNIEEVQEGFNLDLNDNVASAETMSEEQMELVVKHGYGGTPQQFMYDSMKRTDKLARQLMFEHVAKGEMTDERKLVRETQVPLAIVNGENDMFIHLDVLDKLEFGNLWKGKAIRIKGSGHGSYWDNPDEFMPYLIQFAAYCYV